MKNVLIYQTRRLGGASLLALVVGMSACRQDTSPKSPTTSEPAAQPSTSRAASGDKTRAGSSQPGGVTVVNRADTFPVAKNPPNTPPFLPRNEETGAWVRHAPARVYGPDALAALLDDTSLLPARAPLSLQHAAECAPGWASDVARNTAAGSNTLPHLGASCIVTKHFSGWDV